MKNEGALGMRFKRHDGIYRSDVSFLLFTPGACPAFRSGRCQGIGHAGKNMPCPSSAMSSGRLFLDRGARQHCPSPLHRQGQDKTLDHGTETNYHRTARCGLTGCLTLGVHFSHSAVVQSPFSLCSAAVRCACAASWSISAAFQCASCMAFPPA